MSVLKDTAGIRMKLLEVLDQIENKEITAVEARLKIGAYRAILDTLKVEMAAAHLARLNIPSVPLAVTTGKLISGRARRDQ